MGTLSEAHIYPRARKDKTLTVTLNGQPFFGGYHGILVVAFLLHIRCQEFLSQLIM
jgi:hypothetical protein